ncbi:MAG: methylated-DNA--[protein]-cysteine S-methyltransferase [Asgard group archaeon]|nr:methylated-DNA--[protein]-cysteine S-methyltransferase [Asgard group archaeon]
MTSLYYTTFSSSFGSFTIVWKDMDIKIQRIFLSDQTQKSEVKTIESFPNSQIGTSPEINSQGKKIQQFLNGEDVNFNLELLDFSLCYDTQKKVLLAEYNIPRGWISTYKRIANHIGIINGARVVGNSLAKNPFPIFIPCHRAIKSNGELGGYQGGLAMKKTLLELEGIKVVNNKVLTDKIYY